MSQQEEVQTIDSTAETVSSEEVTTEKKSDLGAQWIRLAYMLLFWIALRISEFVVGITMLMQFIYRLTNGEHQPKLMAFGDSLSQYVASIAAFQTYQTEEKPFPLGSWPEPKNPPVESSSDTSGDEAKAST